MRGAVALGIGFGLSEEMLVKDANITNPNFKQYQVPRVKDMPDISVIFVESDDPNGPCGAIGLDEPALTPTAPAIAKAIYHAAGICFTEVPIAPNRVKKELEKLKNHSD